MSVLDTFDLKGKTALVTGCKRDIDRITMAIANERSGRGVKVDAIAPGYISTAKPQAHREDPVRSEQIMARIPAGRWGDPEDGKGPVGFLASDAARYMHGTTMLVDGGWMGH